MNPAITFCHSAGSQIDGCCWCLPFILLVAMDTKLRVLTTSRFISFSPEQVVRFLRLRTFVFHLITFLWHAFLNYHTTNVVFYIFETRMDLVRQTYGLGAQYITLWNQVWILLFKNLLLFTKWRNENQQKNFENWGENPQKFKIKNT